LLPAGSRSMKGSTMSLDNTKLSARLTTPTPTSKFAELAERAKLLQSNPPPDLIELAQQVESIQKEYWNLPRAGLRANFSTELGKQEIECGNLVCALSDLFKPHVPPGLLEAMNNEDDAGIRAITGPLDEDAESAVRGAYNDNEWVRFVHVLDRLKPKLEAHIFTLSDEATIPTRQWILGERLLARTITEGFAAPGVGKTLLSMVSALAIAAGRPLTGETVHISGPVLLINNEEPLDEMKRRLVAACREFQITAAEIAGKVHLYSGLDNPPLIMARKAQGEMVIEADGARMLTELCKAKGIVHFVLDPLVSAHQGVNENDNPAMQAVTAIVARAAGAAACSGEIIHHTRKGDGRNPSAETPDQDGDRGAGAVGGVVRGKYQLNRVSRRSLLRRQVPMEHRAENLIALRSHKANYAARSNGVVAVFRMKSIAIKNGPGGTDGDKVGVPVHVDLLAAENVLSQAERVATAIAAQMDAMGVTRAPASDFYPAIEAAFKIKRRAAIKYFTEAFGKDGEPIEIELSNGKRFAVRTIWDGNGTAAEVILTSIKDSDPD
jgi:RecA-family ATPase